jgi:hypothetical protein
MLGGARLVYASSVRLAVIKVQVTRVFSLYCPYMIIVLYYCATVLTARIYDERLR